MPRNGNNQGNFGDKSLQSLTDLPLHSYHENPDTQESARGDPSRALSIQDAPATGNNTSTFDLSFSPTETRETIPTSEDFANTGTARYFNPREDCSRTQQLPIFDTHECLSCTYGASASSDFHTDTERAAIRSCSVPDPSTEAAAQASDRSQALPIRGAGGNDLPVVNPISDNASSGYVQMEQRSADASRGVDITQRHASCGNNSLQGDGSFKTQLKCVASGDGASARSSIHGETDETSAKEIEQGATAAANTNASNENSDFDLLLIGKTGNGKSATGNSIAEKKVFESKPSTSSVTTKVSRARVELQEGAFYLVDTPGVWDTRISEDQIKEDIKYSIAINPRGYHAFLLVLQYANRLTEEEIKTISILREIFGDKFLKDRGILVLSHGDQFARDNENQEYQKTIEEYCSEQTGPFYDLYLDCGKRVVIFDNVTKDTDVKKNQVKKLIELVKSLGSKHRFKDENFMMAEKVHKSFESVREQIQVYFEVLDDVKPFNNADEAVNILLQFSGRTDDLLKEIHTADNETHALDDYRKIIDALNNLILEKLEISFRMQDDKVNQKGLQAVFDSWQSQYGKQRSAYEEFRDRGRSFLDLLVKAVSWTFQRL